MTCAFCEGPMEADERTDRYNGALMHSGCAADLAHDDYVDWLMMQDPNDERQ